MRSAAGVLLLIAFMIVFVFSKAWPSFSHNGLAWFGPGGSVDEQLTNIFNSPAEPERLRLHPARLAAALRDRADHRRRCAARHRSLAALGDVHRRVRACLAGDVLQPVIRLLAAVPSVIYGLIGILVLVPFVGNHVISGAEKESVQYVIQLDGAGLVVGVLVLTVMISPIMIAIVSDALRAVPRNWTEGAAALGVNRWRAMRDVGLRAARPAIVAAAVLATARALGEAIMLSMVSGSHGFAPNPLDGVTFLFEPAPTARGGDRRQRRGALGPALRPDDLRLRRGPAGLQRLPLASPAGSRRRSMRKYTADGSRLTCMSAPTSERAATPPAPSLRPLRGDESWSSATGSGSAWPGRPDCCSA